MKQQYMYIKNFILVELKHFFAVLSLIFLIFTVITTVYYNVSGEEVDASFEELNGVVETETDEEEMNIAELILDNVTVNLMYMLTGILPFCFIPVLMLVVNSMPLGASLGYVSYSQGVPIIEVLFLRVLPHGIFEIPALILSITLGFYICKVLTLKIVKKDKRVYIDEQRTITDEFKDVIKVFVMVVIPLIIIGAVIETYVTYGLLSSVF